jgi:hypothetical protein
MMIEYLVQTLPCLLFDMTIDRSLISLSDTLIALTSVHESLLPYTLSVLGCLLTSTSNHATLNISESFVQLIVKLTNSWTLNVDGIDNLCHLIIILLQKSIVFRQAFYAHLCYLRVYEEFRAMLNNQITIQTSIIVCTLTCLSYYTRLNDDHFNYQHILNDLTTYSENNRSNRSWFESLVRLSLSQQYQNRRIRWKNSIHSRNLFTNDFDDEHVNDCSSFDSHRQQDDEASERIHADEIYHADVESLSDQLPKDIIKKLYHNRYSNLIVFPEIILLGLRITWQNVDHEWNDQQLTMKTPVYVRRHS